MRCATCNEDFAGDDVPRFISKGMYADQASYAKAMDIIEFWGNGWAKRLEEPDHAFLHSPDMDALARHVEQSATWHEQQQSIYGLEIAREDLNGKTVLNIGCGAGGEALLLSRQGASCIAMDITQQAAASADRLLTKVGNPGLGIQADARFLPIKDNSVDVICSSGVLHHSPDMTRSIAEAHRVLKPGGVMYVMLYAKWSIMFLQEKLLRWTGEQAWETQGRTNPLTTTHTVTECRRLFSNFATVMIEKRGGSVRHLAKVGRFLPKALDYFVEKPLGANLNIVAKKAA